MIPVNAGDIYRQKLHLLFNLDLDRHAWKGKMAEKDKDGNAKTYGERPRCFQLDDGGTYYIGSEV